MSPSRIPVWVTPMTLSLVLSFPMSYAIALVVTPGTGKIRTVLGLIGFGVFISAIIATQSRGGLLAVVAVMGIFGLRIIKSEVPIDQYWQLRPDDSGGSPLVSATGNRVVPQKKGSMPRQWVVSTPGKPLSLWG